MSYRCISLLYSLEMMVEMVAGRMVSAHSQAIRGFHPGQYGCRVGRSAVAAVGFTIAQVQEAWGWRCIVGALLMDIAPAFPSVARGCLNRKMRGAGLDENLIKWNGSFRRYRKAIISIDDQDGQPAFNKPPRRLMTHLTDSFGALHHGDPRDS